MTIPYRIVIAKKCSSKEKLILSRKILEVFHTIDTVYNNWNPYSEVSKINRSPANTPLFLSIELNEFLKKIDALYTLSEGRFDPTLGTLKTLWLFYLKNQNLPPENLWKQSYKEIGWHNLKIDFKKQTLVKSYSQLQLDLCGVVKGFAVDCLLEVCQQFCPDNYVEWGGEIKTSGHHPSGRLWQVASTSTSTILELNHCAIATSGSYSQCWNINGKVYTHIIDPLSGKPLEKQEYPIQSVSVLHPSCAYADALATILMTFKSKAEAEAWALKHGIHAYISDNVAS